MSRPVWTAVLAATLLTACGGDDAGRAQAYRASGDRYAQRGRDAAAVIEYRNALRLSPAFTEAHQALAAALGRLGRSEAAARARDAGERTVDGRPLPDDEEALRAVVAAHPQHIGARLALANHLLQRRELTEAEQHLRAALAIDPARELPNRALASLLVDRDPAEAEACLRRAAAAVPQHHRSTLALADFLFARRRWRDAATVLAQAETQPELADAVALRRMALRDAAGAHAEARHELEDRLQSHPDADAWALRAEFAWRDGDRDGALEAARQALTLNPAHAAAGRLVEAAQWQQVRPPRPARAERGRPSAGPR